MKRLLLLAAPVIFMASCAGSKKNMTTTPVEKPATNLYETKWALKKIHGETGVEDVTTKAFIKFNEEKKSAGGNGSCNTFGSNAAVSGNTVSFTNIFSTKMFCEGVQQIENHFLAALGKVSSYEINGNSLLLKNSNSVLLEFVAE